MHLLEEQNLILHVKSMINPSSVKFDFFDILADYAKINEKVDYKVECDQMTRTTIVRDV